MKTAYLLIITLVVIITFFTFLILRGKAKRKLQQSQTNISKLKEGKANYEFEIKSNYNDSSIQKIKNSLEGNNFRIIENVNDGLIAYSGKSEDAVLGGWLNVNPLTLPLRISISRALNNTIKVQFADDYGFQILNAKQKQKFNEVYTPLFSQVENLIKNSLN